MIHFQDLKTTTDDGSCETNGLSTYHMKTCFLWTCEKLPEGSWRRENMAYCVAFFLNQLHQYLKKRNMPHYFIPSNNLLDQLDDACLEQIRNRVGLIKENLVDYLLNFRTNFKFFTGPFLSSYERIWKAASDLMNNSASLSTLYVMTAQELGGLYLADAPLCQRLADDMLSCYGKLFKGKHTLRSHNCIIVQPFLCAIDVLKSAAFWTDSKIYESEATEKASYGKIIELCKKLHEGIHEQPEKESRRQLDSALRGLESFTLETLAKELKGLALESLPNSYPQMGNFQDQLSWMLAAVSSLFACHLVLQYDTTHDSNADYLRHLNNWLKEMKGKVPNIYVEAVTFIIAKSLVKKRNFQEAIELTQDLPKSSQILNYFERERSELMEACAKGIKQNHNDRYTDRYFGQTLRIAYGSIFETAADNGLQCRFQWEVMYFTKFKTLADKNSFKPSFGKLAERKFLEGIFLSSQNSEKNLVLRTDYANFLVACNRYREALDLLKDVVKDVEAAGYDVYSEYNGFLKLVIFQDLWRGMSKSMYKKVSFHCLIHAFFFIVMSHTTLGEKEKALEMVKEMEVRCDTVYDLNKAKVSWEVNANNYSLLGHAYRICEVPGKAIMAFAIVTYLRGDIEQPSGHRPIKGMRTFNLHCDTAPIVCLNTAMQLLWVDSDPRKTFPPLIRTLYPHLPISRSIMHFYHLIHDKTPVPSDAKAYLQVLLQHLTSEKQDMNIFGLCFSLMVETTFPAIELLDGLKHFLGYLYPAEIPRNALIKYVRELSDKHEISEMVDAVIRKFFLKETEILDPWAVHINTILTLFL